MEQEINKVSYIFKYKGKVTSEKSTKEKRLEPSYLSDKNRFNYLRKHNTSIDPNKNIINNKSKQYEQYNNYWIDKNKYIIDKIKFNKECNKRKETKDKGCQQKVNLEEKPNNEIEQNFKRYKDKNNNYFVCYDQLLKIDDKRGKERNTLDFNINNDKKMDKYDYAKTRNCGMSEEPFTNNNDKTKDNNFINNIGNETKIYEKVFTKCQNKKMDYKNKICDKLYNVKNKSSKNDNYQKNYNDYNKSEFKKKNDNENNKNKIIDEDVKKKLFKKKN